MAAHIPVMVLKCTCKHEAQDQLHGRGMRVHNPKEKKGIKGETADYTCIVCGSLKPNVNFTR